MPAAFFRLIIYFLITIFLPTYLITVNVVGNFSEALISTSYVSVLILAGVELIFFIVSSIRLCLEIVFKAVLIIQGYFSYCWAVLTQNQGLSAFHNALPPSRLGVHKKLGGDCRVKGGVRGVW